jgi:coenzyme F420-reducing hydrogenase beta subunit
VHHEAMRNTIIYAKAIHTSTLLAVLKTESLESSRMLIVCIPISTQALREKKDQSDKLPTRISRCGNSGLYLITGG